MKRVITLILFTIATVALSQNVSVINVSKDATACTTGFKGPTPVICDQVALTGQTGSISTTNLQCNGAICPAGLYLLEPYYVTTACSSGSVRSISLSENWTDDAQAQTFVIGVSNTCAIGDSSVQEDWNPVLVQSNGTAQIAYSTTLGGLSGTIGYSLYLTLERIQ